MSRRVVWTILCLLAAVGTATAGERTVQVTEQTCARLVAHTPADDVEYQGGVTVHGESVAPAEVGGGHDLDLPRTISIPISVELVETDAVPGRDDAEADGDTAGDPNDGATGDTNGGTTGNSNTAERGGERPVDRAGFSADAEVGTVKVDLETGRATFNGRPITSEAQHELAKRCRKKMTGR